VTLEQVLLLVWRQALVEGARSVEVDGRSYPVRATAKRRLKEVDFTFEDRSLRGIEQNPDTGSRWAEMARLGAKIMQFVEAPQDAAQARGRFFANVADGKLNWYGGARSSKR